MSTMKIVSTFIEKWESIDFILCEPFKIFKFHDWLSFRICEQSELTTDVKIARKKYKKMIIDRRLEKSITKIAATDIQLTSLKNEKLCWKQYDAIWIKWMTDECVQKRDHKKRVGVNNAYDNISCFENLLVYAHSNCWLKPRLVNFSTASIHHRHDLSSKTSCLNTVMKSLLIKEISCTIASLPSLYCHVLNPPILSLVEGYHVETAFITATRSP